MFEVNSTLEGIVGELIVPAVKRKELVSRLVACFIYFRSMTHILASGLMTRTMTHYCMTTRDSS
jgi:hypothetical protein